MEEQACERGQAGRFIDAGEDDRINLEAFTLEPVHDVLFPSATGKDEMF